MSGFGYQTVVFVHYEPTGDPDALGARTLTPTRTAVPGCRHRPMKMEGRGAGAARAEQQPEIGVAVATQWWRTTVPWGRLDPAVAAVVAAAKPSDIIEVDGVPYQIISGVGLFPTFTVPSHITITSVHQAIG